MRILPRRNRYVKRFENNYASSGQAFNNDAFVNSDMDYCLPYAEMAGRTLDAAFGASNWRKGPVRQTSSSIRSLESENSIRLQESATL